MKQSLFRNIRKKLFLRRPAEGDYAGQVVSGKLVRYLTYALGEIVLIVVGILFALELNNWSEDRTDAGKKLLKPLSC